MIALGNEKINYISLGSTEVVKVYLGTEKVYPVDSGDTRDYSKEYMTLEFLEDGTYKQYSSSVPSALYYSLNDGDWIKYTTSGVAVKKGDKVRLKSTNTKAIYNSSNPLINKTTPSYNVYGNVNSIYAGDDFETDLSRIYSYQCQSWFSGTNVVDASNLVLPYTVLTNYCYRYMFQNCTLLEKAPKLPVLALSPYCYQYMFDGCTSLTVAPELLATELNTSCYQYMFQNCKALTKIQKELPAMELKQTCYSNMYNGCESITTAPELPALTLVSGAYQSMFKNCKSLNYIKCLVEEFYNSATSDWVSGVAPEGTFVQAPYSEWTIGTSGIPTGWVIEGKKEVDLSEIYMAIDEQFESPFFVDGTSKITPVSNKYNYFSSSSSGTSWSTWVNAQQKTYTSKTYLKGSRWSASSPILDKFTAEKVGGNIASIYNNSADMTKDIKLKSGVGNSFVNNLNYTGQMIDASRLYMPYQGEDTFYNGMFNINVGYSAGMKYGPILTSLGNGQITFFSNMGYLQAFGLYYGGQENKTLSELVKLPDSVGIVYVNKEAEPFLTNDTAWNITYIDMPNLITE